jgi:hypothetical protein
MEDTPFLLDGTRSGAVNGVGSGMGLIGYGAFETRQRIVEGVQYHGSGMRSLR